MSTDRNPAARRTSRSSAPMSALSSAADRRLLLPGHGRTVSQGSDRSPGSRCDGTPFDGVLGRRSHSRVRPDPGIACPPYGPWASAPNQGGLARDRASSTRPPALLEGSTLLQKGRADVFRQRERTKRQAARSARSSSSSCWTSTCSAASSTATRFKLPTLPEDWVILLFPLLILIPVHAHGRDAADEREVAAHHRVTRSRSRSGSPRSRVSTRRSTRSCGRSTSSSGTPPSGTSSAARRGAASCSRVRPAPGKTYLAKAMAKQAGVPFLFISAPSFQSMWQGMTAYRIRSFFKALRKAARKEGGAIGFIEEIDAIGDDARRRRSEHAGRRTAARSRLAVHGLGRSGAMVNELLIQLQSFDQPRLRTRMRGEVHRLGQRVPAHATGSSARSKPEYHNILLIAATNRGDSLDPALLRPGRFDRRLYFDVPTKQRAPRPDRLLPRSQDAPRAARRSDRSASASRTRPSATRP